MCSESTCNEAVYCKGVCRKHYMRAYYRANKDKWRYEGEALERRRAASREASRRRLSTPEGRAAKAASDRSYYLANRERLIAQAREREAAKLAAEDAPFIESKRARVRSRRARRANTGVFRFTPKDWLRLVNRQRGRCFYCGDVAKLEADHVVPIARGGVHSVGNIVAACGPCNRAKWARTVMEFRLYVARRQAAA